MTIDNNEMEKVKDALSLKSALRDCERCGGDSFTLLENYFKFDGQSNLHDTVIGGPTVPAYGVACDNCGKLSFHAVKIVNPDAF